MVKKKTNKNRQKGIGIRKDRGMTDRTLFAFYALGIVVLGMLVFNQFMVGSIMAKMAGDSGSTTGLSSVDVSNILPTGIPDVYGEELGVSYDDISASNSASTEATIAKLASYDTSISLSEMSKEEKERYIEIASQISCEYCCGAKALVFSDGSAACGCAHSYAMRGLAKYLVTEHNELSDERILEELAKWKVLFFPTQSAKRAAALEENGIEVNYINIGSNKYRGIEEGSSGGMVGGC